MRTISRFEVGLILFYLLMVMPAQSQWLQSGSSIYNTNSGNVGIGTTTPANPLHVASYENGNPSLNYHANNALASFDVPGNVELSVGWLGAAPYGYWMQVRNWANASNPLSLNPLGGNVGIGTMTPATALDLQGSLHVGGNTAILTAAASAEGAYIGWNNWGGSFNGETDFINNNGNGSGGFVFTGLPYNYSGSTLPAPWMVINPSGNVGIGTSSPSNKLSVNGTVQAKEVLVNTGWSDYVFDPSYRLAPLTEVASFVQKNHHLPEIPSAAEVAEKGVSIGEMQSKLLAKIEELTLHMIRADERNNQLEQENQKLRLQVTEVLSTLRGLSTGQGMPK